MDFNYKHFALDSDTWFSFRIEHFGLSAVQCSWKRISKENLHGYKHKLLSNIVPVIF